MWLLLIKCSLYDSLQYSLYQQCVYMAVDTYGYSCVDVAFWCWDTHHPSTRQHV